LDGVLIDLGESKGSLYLTPVQEFLGLGLAGGRSVPAMLSALHLLTC
jgi:hypothetical protein